MNIVKYMKDQIIKIICFTAYILIVWLFLCAFKCELELIVVIIVMSSGLFLSLFLWDFFRKKAYYDELIEGTQMLDKKYLVHETLKSPDFYEGQIFYSIMCEINKSMIEHVKHYEHREQDFKDFIEMWVHEIKLPIASLTLMCHNDRENIDKKFLNQVNRLDYYAEQILYYIRAENAEEDYLFSNVSLKTIINKSAMKNKDLILENNIILTVSDVDFNVNTDAKWLEFIINQIISNSIKYKSESHEPEIKIYVEKQENVTNLIIIDNGIGISQKDLPRVFRKSFTGTNGRNNAKSTGMGLYIAKGLCSRLGHKISIDSIEGEYTTVTISFADNNYFEPVQSN